MEEFLSFCGGVSEFTPKRSEGSLLSNRMSEGIRPRNFFVEIAASPCRSR
jgi:hypothetical protein